MNLLFLFSNPPDSSRLRLDKEDSIIRRLADTHREDITVQRLHASDIQSAHELLSLNSFDVIHFSGHGSTAGIFLDSAQMYSDASHLVTAEQLVQLVGMSPSPPMLVVILACYSADARNVLAEAAPFVITTSAAIEDELCLAFTQGFYEKLFREPSVTNAFVYAKAFLSSRRLNAEQFCLSRRALIKREDSFFIKCTPSSFDDTILVNMDAVVASLDSFGMTSEELCHLVARKLKVHKWIFENPREAAILPIGRLLFGEFSWSDARDEIYCNRILRLRSDIDPRLWGMWVQCLMAYNDMASAKYRYTREPGNPENRLDLADALQQFQYHQRVSLTSNKDLFLALGFQALIPNLEFVRVALELAHQHYKDRRFPETIQNLETALTNFHEIVDQLRPPEEPPAMKENVK